MRLSSVSFSVIGLSLLTVIVFGVLEWLGVDHGNYIDWLIAIASFWWLVIVTVIPWNIYFSAKALLEDIQLSRKRKIKVNEEDERYLIRSSKLYLTIAIILHILTAIGLYAIAHFEVSKIGYVGAVAAFLLTFLRPMVRLYQYIIKRLSTIGRNIKYPRDDVQTLLNQTKKLKTQQEAIQEKLKDIYKILNPNEPGIIKDLNQKIIKNENTLNALKQALGELKTTNQAAHDHLESTVETHLKKLSEDAQFLGQVRDLIRFIKNA